MKKHFLIFLILPLFMVISGCFKKPEPIPCTYDPCTVKAPEAEITAVQQYLDSAGIIDATQHCSGLYYKIVDPGTAKTPTYCQDVGVRYKGMFTNGTVFDSSSAGVVLNLGGVIRGWTNGVPLVKEGGKIKLYIPPSLGYGSNDYRGIPGNSILVFDVELVVVY